MRRRHTTRKIADVEPQQVNIKALKALAKICPNEQGRYVLNSISIDGTRATVTDGAMAAKIHVLKQPIAPCLIVPEFKPRFEVKDNAIVSVTPIETKKGQFPNVQKVLDDYGKNDRVKAQLKIGLLKKAIAVYEALGVGSVVIEIEESKKNKTSDAPVFIRPKTKRVGHWDHELDAEQLDDVVVIMPMRGESRDK